MKNRIYKLFGIVSILLISLFTSCRSHVDSPSKKAKTEDLKKCYLQASCVAERAMVAPNLTNVDFAKAELFEDDVLLATYVTDKDGAAIDKLLEKRLEVLIGKHIYSLKLYNNAGNLLKSDSREKEMQPGVNEIEFNMQIPEGLGKLRIFYNDIDDSVQTAEITVYKFEKNTLVPVKTVTVDKVDDQFAYKEVFDNGYYYVSIRNKTDDAILYQDNVVVETNRRTVYGQENIYTKNSVRIMDSDGKLHVWNYKSNNEIDYLVDNKLVGTTFFDDDTDEFDEQIPAPQLPFTKTDTGYEIKIINEDGTSVVYNVNQNDGNVSVKEGNPITGMNTPAVIDYLEFKKYDDEQNIIEKLVANHEYDAPMVKITPQTLNASSTKKFAKVESENELAALIYLDTNGKMVIDPYSSRDEEAALRTDKDLISTVTITYDDNTTDYFTVKINDDGTIDTTYLFKSQTVYIKPEDLGYDSYSSFAIDAENSLVDGLVTYELVTSGEHAGEIKVVSKKIGSNVYDVKGTAQTNPNVSKKVQVTVDYAGNIIYSVLANSSINLTIPDLFYEDYKVGFSINFEYPDEILQVTKFTFNGYLMDDEKNIIIQAEDDGTITSGNDSEGNPLKLDLTFEWYVDGQLFTKTKDPSLVVYSNQIGAGTHDITISTIYEGKKYSNNTYLDVKPFIGIKTDYQIKMTYYDVVELDEDGNFIFKPEILPVVDEWYESMTSELDAVANPLDFSKIPGVKKVTETWYDVMAESMELQGMLEYDPYNSEYTSYRFNPESLFVKFDGNDVAQPRFFSEDLLFAITDLEVDGYTVIGQGSFGEMVSLKNLTFGEGTGIIESEVGILTAMETLNLPKTVTSIGEMSFLGNKLKQINVEEGNLVYASVDGVLYSKDLSTIYLYPGEKEDSEFTLPKSVKNIAMGAFAITPGLKKINFQNTLKTVAPMAFYYSGIEELDTTYLGSEISDEAFVFSNLKKVTITPNIKYIAGGAFAYCPIENICFEGTVPPEIEWPDELFTEVEYLWDDENDDYALDAEGNKIVEWPGFDPENFAITVPKESFGDYAEIFEDFLPFLKWPSRPAVTEWTLAEHVADTEEGMSFEINHYYVPEGVTPVKVTIDYKGDTLTMEPIEDETDPKYYSEANLNLIIQEMNYMWAEETGYCDFMDVTNIEFLAYMYSTFLQTIDNDFYYLSLDATGTVMEDMKMDVKVEFSDGKTFEYSSIMISF